MRRGVCSVTVAAMGAIAEYHSRTFSSLSSKQQQGTHPHLTKSTYRRGYSPFMINTTSVPQRGLHTTPTWLAASDIAEDLAKDIQDIIHNDRLVLFLTGTPEAPRCRFTMQMVDLMDQLGVRYGYFNILDDDEVCEGLKKYSSWPTYPQVYLDGELLGGYDICKEMLLDGSLTKLFKEKDLL